MDTKRISIALLLNFDFPYDFGSPPRGQAVNDPESIGDKDRRVSRPVFVSYATADRKLALSVCEAIESRGTACWISCRRAARSSDISCAPNPAVDCAAFSNADRSAAS